MLSPQIKVIWTPPYAVEPNFKMIPKRMGVNRSPAGASRGQDSDAIFPDAFDSKKT